MKPTVTLVKVRALLPQDIGRTTYKEEFVLLNVADIVSVQISSTDIPFYQNKPKVRVKLRSGDTYLALGTVAQFEKLLREAEEQGMTP